LNEVLERCYEEMGIDEIQFSQWTATDSSNLEAFVKAVEDFLGFVLKS